MTNTTLHLGEINNETTKSFGQLERNNDSN